MFTTVADAFNHYRTMSIADMEQRAQEVKGMIETDPDVDIKALNIELTGLNEAKKDAQDKQDGTQGEPEARTHLTGMSFTTSSFEARTEKVQDTAEYRNAFYKSLMGKSLTSMEQRALNKAMDMEKRDGDAYTTSGNTPVLIPTTTLNEIVSKARNEGGTLSIARAFNMPTKIAIPVATPADAAVWNTEGTPVDSEQPTITSVTFDGNELIKVFSISAKVRTMSIDAFEAYLADELYKCVYEAIANALINGTGAGQGMGLLNGVTWTAGTNLVEATAEIEYLDTVEAVALLKRGYARNAKWVMNQATLYKQFYGMVDSNGKPIFVPDPRDERVGRILGFDIVVDDYVPDGTCFFGDFNYLAYNLANGIAVESSTQSSFKSGRIDYRGMAIADTQVIVPEAFIQLTAGA